MSAGARTWLVAGLGLLLAACGSAAPPAAAPSTSLATPKPASSAGAAAPASAKPAAASAPAYATGSPSSAVTTSFADNQTLGTAPIYIALDRGYFKAQGLNVELIPLNAIPQIIQSLASSQVAFATANPDPALFNALERGLDIKLLASLVNNKPGDKPAALLIRKDLVDGGQYKSPKDLKGMRLASNAAQGQFYVSRFLAQGGLNLSDVQIQNVPLPNVATAFADKSIDAAWSTEPFNTAMESRGLAKVVAVTGDLFPGAVGVVLALSPGFAQSQPDASRRFVYAFLQGLRDYYHAFIAKDGDRGPAVQALINHTPVKDPNLYNVIGLQGVDPNGTLDLSSWDAFQDYFIKNGFQKTRIDLKKYEEPSYITTAVAQLGKI